MLKQYFENWTRVHRPDPISHDNAKIKFLKYGINILGVVKYNAKSCKYDKQEEYT